jgi:hypothetical protein
MGPSFPFPYGLFACRDYRLASGPISVPPYGLHEIGQKQLIFAGSARGLKEHQKEIIKKSFTKQVDYEEKVNPDLLAGVRFTLNGEMQYDGSLAHMMSELFPSK